MFRLLFLCKGGTSPSANAGSEGIVRFRRLQEGKGGGFWKQLSAPLSGDRGHCVPPGASSGTGTLSAANPARKGCLAEAHGREC